MRPKFRPRRFRATAALMAAVGTLGCASGRLPLGPPTVSPEIRTTTSVGDSPIGVVAGLPGNSAEVRPRYSDLSERAEGRITGRVLDDRGQPAAGAEVRVADGSAPFGPLIAAEADEAGRFTLNGLRPGTEYTLIAETGPRGTGLHGRGQAVAPESDVRIRLASEDRAFDDLKPSEQITYENDNDSELRDAPGDFDRLSPFDQPAAEPTDRFESSPGPIPDDQIDFDFDPAVDRRSTRVEADRASYLNEDDLPPAREADAYNPGSDPPSLRSYRPPPRPIRDVSLAWRPADSGGFDQDDEDPGRSDRLDPAPIVGPVHPPDRDLPRIGSLEPTGTDFAQDDQFSGTSFQASGSESPRPILVEDPSPIQPSPPPRRTVPDRKAFEPVDAPPSEPTAEPTPARSSAAPIPTPTSRPGEIVLAPATVRDPRDSGEPTSEAVPNLVDPPPLAPRETAEPAGAGPSNEDIQSPSIAVPDLASEPFDSSDLSSFTIPDPAEPTDLDPPAPPDAGISDPIEGFGSSIEDLSADFGLLTPPAVADSGAADRSPEVEMPGPDDLGPMSLESPRPEAFEPSMPKSTAPPEIDPGEFATPDESGSAEEPSGDFITLPPSWSDGEAVDRPSVAVEAQPTIPSPTVEIDPDATGRPTWSELSAQAARSDAPSPLESSQYPPSVRRLPPAETDRSSTSRRGGIGLLGRRTDPPGLDAIEPVEPTCRFDARRNRLVDFQLPDPQGRPVRFAEIDADYVLLDFWGTWCGPCLRTVPELAALQSRYDPKRLRVVGVAVERGGPAENASKVESAARDLGINYPLVMADPRPEGEPSPLAEALKIREFPTLVLLDRQGRILWRSSGGGPEGIAKLERVVAANARNETIRR